MCGRAKTRPRQGRGVGQEAEVVPVVAASLLDPLRVPAEVPVAADELQEAVVRPRVRHPLSDLSERERDALLTLGERRPLRGAVQDAEKLLALGRELAAHPGA